MLSLLLVAALAQGADDTARIGTVWRPDGLAWRGQTALMQANDDRSYALTGPFGNRRIPPQPMRSDTASPLFDGLFAMAQDDLAANAVEAIQDPAFDHGDPIPCHCYVTGVKWPFVWTRDLSYAVDLGLWRVDPERARNGLRFKLSQVRERSAPKGLLVMQDTGSGGSWPISTDRVVWFLAARHLQDDPAFARDTWRALRDTLAQERLYAFDPSTGLYRGETSFLDWREQTYPAWNASDVTFIGQSFALSTNVLHYQALEQAAVQADAHKDADAAADYRAQADALRGAINRYFWRDDNDLYMSYVGGEGLPYDTYDLLGTALAITSGVADPKRAAKALANYPTWPAGSPVIWPERSDQPVYHNRAIWPFVSAYALRAARTVDDPARIAHELGSLMRGAALAGSNMENYELQTQAVHVDEGKLSGPVVNSPRQLWSVAGYLDAVIEGVFGFTDDGNVEPKLPTSLVPMLFGTSDHITLHLTDRDITLVLPKQRDGNLLVADHAQTSGKDVRVTLKAIAVHPLPMRTDAPLYAKVAPPAPTITDDGPRWRIHTDGETVLYVDGERQHLVVGGSALVKSPDQRCVNVTREDQHGIESLHSQDACVGEGWTLPARWPQRWTASRDGRYRAWFDYSNGHGPINTGITGAVKWLVVRCEGQQVQRLPIALPHSDRMQASTWATFQARSGAACRFTLDDGFNMSYLAQFAHYTGGEGGRGGPLNAADIDTLHLAPVGDARP